MWDVSNEWLENRYQIPHLAKTFSGYKVTTAPWQLDKMDKHNLKVYGIFLRPQIKNTHTHTHSITLAFVLCAEGWKHIFFFYYENDNWSKPEQATALKYIIKGPTNCYNTLNNALWDAQSKWCCFAIL